MRFHLFHPGWAKVESGTEGVLRPCRPAPSLRPDLAPAVMVGLSEDFVVAVSGSHYWRVISENDECAYVDSRINNCRKDYLD